MTDTRPGRRARLDPAKLRAWRETRNLTQAQLAAKAGVSRTLVTNAETGVTGISKATLGKIAKALGVPHVKLLADELLEQTIDKDKP